MSQKSITKAPNSSIAVIFSRYYWLQIALIALAVVLGVFFSGTIMKGLLLSTAMEQEQSHFWSRYEKNPNAPLPDTKNLYGYLWSDEKPESLQGINFSKHGVQHVLLNGRDRLVTFDEKYGKKLLLVFGESNVNRLIWIFGLAPLLVSLFFLYSALWFFNRKAHNQISPVTRLANAIKTVNISHESLPKQPFESVDTGNNIEVKYLKSALSNYHDKLTSYIERERLFTREVSHELRTPLSVIKGSIQLLEQKEPNNPTLSRMQQTANDMQLIIETLLTLAREGSEVIDIELVDLSTVIDKVFKDLEFAANEAEIKLHNTIESLDVQGNRSIVYMIVSNLVRNSINYSQGTKVNIYYQAPEIFVEDDGVGVEASQLLETTIKGHGIGLKLVKRLCERIDWTVRIDQKNQQSQGLRIAINTQSYSHQQQADD